MCVFNDGYAFHEEVNVHDDGSMDVIETAAFKMDFVFVSNIGWFNESSYDDTFNGIASPVLGRSLKEKKKCTNQADQQSCCVADGILMSSKTYTDKIKACAPLGCKVEVCA